jgi:hypothetical protein
MVSPQTNETVEAAGGLREEDVKEWAKSSGLDWARRYELSHSVSRDKIEIQRHQIEEQSAATLIKFTQQLSNRNLPEWLDSM